MEEALPPARSIRANRERILVQNALGWRTAPVRERWDDAPACGRMTHADVIVGSGSRLPLSE